MNAEQLKTKDKIINVAGELFARHGFNGTSVREIAKIADVNLSAINYHFDNKENLYFKVFENNYQWMEENINRIALESEDDIKSLALNVFDFFMNNGAKLIQIYKVFLSDIDIPTDSPCMKMQEEGGAFGPPGHAAFMKVIHLDVGDSVPHEGQFWAMQAIFSNLVNSGVKLATSFVKEHAKLDPRLKPENFRRDIEFQVEAIIEYMKAHPENWS
jgi:AcrR family transcriptional regulator